MSTLCYRGKSVDIKLNFHVDLLNFDLNNLPYFFPQNTSLLCPFPMLPIVPLIEWSRDRVIAGVMISMPKKLDHIFKIKQILVCQWNGLAFWYFITCDLIPDIGQAPSSPALSIPEATMWDLDIQPSIIR
jgi:hypothetical protein